MELFAALPFYKPSDKAIYIYDSNHEEIGYVQRNYTSRLNRVANHLSISILENTNIIGEQDGYTLEIQEQSFKANLLKLKWDVYLERDGNKESFLMEDLTKISTDSELAYHKKEHRYLLKKDGLSGNWLISIEDSPFICAEIKVLKQVPNQIKITLNTHDLKAIEVLGMYYVIHLVY